MATKPTIERLNLVMEAAWEIDALARVLPGMVPLVPEADGAHFLVRAVAGRLLRLTSVLMDVGLMEIAGDERPISDDSMHVFNFEEGQG